MRASHTHVLGSISSFFRLTAGIVVHAITHLDALRRRPVMAVTYKQVYFTGIQALLPAAFAAVAIGFIMETQMRGLLGSGIELNVKMLKLVVLREFAPLFTAFIVLGRSGAAIASELAAMKVQGEIRSLYLMGIDPGEYLLVPRVVGCAVAVPVLTFYFQAIVAGMGPALASVFVEIDLGPYYQALFASITLQELLVSAAKSICFGLVIAAAACSSGIYVPPSRIWIPQAAELAVIRGFLLLLATDAVFALLTL
ncbi:MAG: ABC transporter permease [Verrucomicrobiaceae bacterium]|nr:ABC transporter permease [Verrucomicrobiaceae bacterium]